MGGPVKWLQPISGRGAESDAAYLTVPNNVAGEVAAALTDVEPAMMALFLAMVSESPVTSTLFPAPWSYFIARLGVKLPDFKKTSLQMITLKYLQTQFKFYKHGAYYSKHRKIKAWPVLRRAGFVLESFRGEDGRVNCRAPFITPAYSFTK